MPGLQRASLSLTTIIMLILRLDIHLHNQRDILSLMILMMGRLIPHLLIIIFHHRQSLRLQILIKRDIYIYRGIKLSLCANTSANNVLNQFVNEVAMGKLNMWN